MKDKVARLHQLRGEKLAVNDKLAQSRQEWEESDQVQTYLGEQEQIDSEMYDLQEDIKAQRVASYDGEDKGKVFGVGIREETKLDYMEVDALAWAVQHQLALKLDKRGFEKIAKIDPPDFVTMTKVLAATIAADLSKYLD